MYSASEQSRFVCCDMQSSKASQGLDCGGFFDIALVLLWLYIMSGLADKS